MNKCYLLTLIAFVASLLFMLPAQAIAQAKMLSTSAEVTETCEVQSRTETLVRKPVDGTRLGSKYFVSKPSATKLKCKMAASGGLLDIPGFGWLKSTSFSDKGNADTKEATSRILFNNAAGVNNPGFLTLTRESRYDAKTGQLTGDYHESWEVHLTETTDGFSKKHGALSYQVEPSDTQAIIDSYRQDFQSATENVIQKEVQAACGSMCRIEFDQVGVDGLDGDKAINVNVYPDESDPRAQVALIDWPAISLSIKFTVHAKTAADIKAGK